MNQIDVLRQRLGRIRFAAPDYLYLTKQYPKNKQYREEAKEDRAFNKSHALEEKYKYRARDPTHRTDVDKSKEIPYGKENRTYEEQSQDAYNRMMTEWDQEEGAKGIGDFKENIYTSDLYKADAEKRKGIKGEATKKLEGASIGLGEDLTDIPPWKPIGYKPMKIYPGREEYVGRPSKKNRHGLDRVKQMVHKPKRKQWTRIIQAKQLKTRLARLYES